MRWRSAGSGVARHSRTPMSPRRWSSDWWLRSQCARRSSYRRHCHPPHPRSVPTVRPVPFGADGAADAAAAADCYWCRVSPSRAAAPASQSSLLQPPPLPLRCCCSNCCCWSCCRCSNCCYCWPSMGWLRLQTRLPLHQADPSDGPACASAARTACAASFCRSCTRRGSHPCASWRGSSGCSAGRSPCRIRRI